MRHSFHLAPFLAGVLILLYHQGLIFRSILVDLAIFKSSKHPHSDELQQAPDDLTAFEYLGLSSHHESSSSSSFRSSTDQRIHGSHHHNRNGDDENDDHDHDLHCPFRNSSLYRSIYVYPSPGDNDWRGDILSKHGPNIPSWPWISIDQESRLEAKAHYNPFSSAVQYTTELLVRDILTHPESCLRTYDPDQAALFYVPYLPSVEYHNGTLSLGDYHASPYGQALMDATELGNYDAWETTFGLTSKYWQRRNGSDHILVFSEPLHGLYHPKSKRGSFHYMHSQKQLTPPIVISVELSTTFVQKYPFCARKNILMPYPNTDGKWFNGKYDQESKELFQGELYSIAVMNSTAALPAEQTLLETKRQKNEQPDPSRNMIRLNDDHDDDFRTQPRPMAQFYNGRNHGTCTRLRRAMETNFQCSPSAHLLRRNRNKHLQKYMLAYRQATFCPCPGGDSPSAKRMFDALHAGCIPLILSEDFVWPFTSEFDLISTGSTAGDIVTTKSTSTGTISQLLRPNDFSIRLETEEYLQPAYTNASTCEFVTSEALIDDHDDVSTRTAIPTIQTFLEFISPTTINRLRHGTRQASDQYSYYARREDLPDNPLRENVLPDGGAAHALVKALEERAYGRLWPACQEELQRGSARPNEPDARQFKC